MKSQQIHLIWMKITIKLKYTDELHAENIIDPKKVFTFPNHKGAQRISPRYTKN
jgi:hypothetical protein